MTDKVQLIKEEIERIEQILDDFNKTHNNTIDNGIVLAKKNICKHIKSFIDSIPEEPCCKIDLTAENENKMFEEIDRYCTLCMDINCFGCQFHDIHFRHIINMA